MTTSVDVTISAGSDQVRQPWLWQLSRDFNVRLNVVKAMVDEDSGSLLVRLEGQTEEIQRAIAWLMTTGMHVESQQRAVGAT